MRDMAGAMQMDDSALFGSVLIEQLEWRHGPSEDTGDWQVQGWYGGDYSKLWMRTEGSQGGDDANARLELLWDRVVARWWSVQAGARQDFTGGPARTWAALGVQGLSVYWFELEATLYLGSGGRTAARLRAQYELLITQRLILEPEVEANFYDRADPARGIGTGLADLDAGLRLRYEIRRDLGPYVGAVWTREDSGEEPAAACHCTRGWRIVAGLRALL